MDENERRIRQLENAVTFAAENVSFAGEDMNELFESEIGNLFLENSRKKVNENNRNYSTNR